MSERNTAIVLAAGQGKRMHSKVQKQFLEIAEIQLLSWQQARERECTVKYRSSLWSLTGCRCSVILCAVFRKVR